MSENKNEKIDANGKLSDDMLDDVSGGVMLNSGMLRKTVYDKSEGAGIHTAIKDETMDGKVRLLDGSVRSGKPGANGQDTMFGQKMQKA